MQVKRDGGLDNNFVLPGDEIGIAEEYLPGRNVADQDGKLMSLAFGNVFRDERRLVLSVRTTKEKHRARTGDIVYGQVVKDDRGTQTVRVGAFEDRSGMLYEIDMTGLIRQPRGHNPDSAPIIKIGDYIRAKITRDGDYYDLGIMSPNLGVIIAFCSLCRTKLMRDQAVLKCPNCDHVERRKIASDYGEVYLPPERNDLK